MLIFFFLKKNLQGLTVKEFAFSFRGEFVLKHSNSARTLKTLITLNTKCILHKEMDMSLLGTRSRKPWFRSKMCPQKSHVQKRGF